MNSSENEKKIDVVSEEVTKPAGADRPVANFLNKYLVTILVGSIAALLVFSAGFGIGSLSTRIHDGHYGERSGWMHRSQGPGAEMMDKFGGRAMRENKHEKLMERRHNERARALKDRAGMHNGAACERRHGDIW